jgi:DNA (cytosine-5)-methyltransferase 1
MTPRILDTYCGAGGAAVGYHRAGFAPYGVEKDPQRTLNYPFPVHVGDARTALATLMRGEKIPFRSRHRFSGMVTQWLALSDFAAVHGSPPCQGYTALAAVHRNDWPKLVPETRDLLDATGLPYVLENVQGSPARPDLVLCGEMFGLAVIRHRYFELGRWTATAPAHKPHRGRVAGMRHGQWFDGPYYAVYGQGGSRGTVAQWQQAMGITWTDVRREIAEAIPPAYTEHIGAQLLAAVRQEVAA